jgi:hypothetical protein
MKLRLVTVAAFAAIFGLTPLAKAKVIYTYTGNDFNTFFTYDPVDYTNPLSSSDFLTIQLTLANSLGANSALAAVGVLAMSASDGLHTFTLSDPGFRIRRI